MTMESSAPYFYALISVLLAVVAYFLRQLLADFKRVEKDVTEVKATMALIKAEFKGINELMNQRIEFLERRIHHLESIIFKTNEHEGK
jgi:cell division protein FtsB